MQQIFGFPFSPTKNKTGVFIYHYCFTYYCLGVKTYIYTHTHKREKERKIERERVKGSVFEGLLVVLYWGSIGGGGGGGGSGSVVVGVAIPQWQSEVTFVK